LTVVAASAFLVLGGCTSESSRAVLTVVSVNGGHTYYSDLLNTADSQHVYIPVDEVVVTLGNIPNDGGAALDPGSPFSEIVVTGYSVTYNPAVFNPISGGLNLRIPSGSTAEGTITISNPSEKAALLATLTSTATSTATIKFTGYNRINGSDNGDEVSGTAYLTVQVDNFGDTDVSP
jgi:hypothetical protein